MLPKTKKNLTPENNDSFSNRINIIQEMFKLKKKRHTEGH